jgi:hypothetical protein
MKIIAAAVQAIWPLCTYEWNSMEQDIVGKQNVSALWTFTWRLRALSVMEAANIL